MSRATRIFVLLLSAALTSACVGDADGGPAPTTTTTVTVPPAPSATITPSIPPLTPAPAPAATADPRERALGLRVDDEVRRDEYRRDAFGQRWADVDGNGCDTRNDVLAHDLTDTVIDEDGCTVLSGMLDDPYSGLTVRFVYGPKTSAEVPIDHVVPLAEAWRSGAWAWSDRMRLDFANDAVNLAATTQAMNSGKSDGDPAVWMPADETGWCDYLNRYVDVKLRYDLAVDVQEFDAITGRLAGC